MYSPIIFDLSTASQGALDPAVLNIGISVCLVFPWVFSDAVDLQAAGRSRFQAPSQHRQWLGSALDLSKLRVALQGAVTPSLPVSLAALEGFSDAPCSCSVLVFTL